MCTKIRLIRTSFKSIPITIEQKTWHMCRPRQRLPSRLFSIFSPQQHRSIRKTTSGSHSFVRKPGRLGGPNGPRQPLVPYRILFPAPTLSRCLCFSWNVRQGHLHHYNVLNASLNVFMDSNNDVQRTVINECTLELDCRWTSLTFAPRNIILL